MLVRHPTDERVASALPAAVLPEGRLDGVAPSALGLRVGRHFSGGGIELLGAEAPIYVLAAVAGAAPFRGATVTRDYARHWTPVHLDFAVEDIAAAVERAVAAGAKVEVPIGQHGYGKMAVLADPFGHGFCLLQFEGRGYDEIATGIG